MSEASVGTVLVAVDFSETSERAFDRACELAAGHRKRLLVLHVLPTTPFTVRGLVPETPPPDLSGRIRELAQGRIDALADRGRQTVDTVETVLSVGAAGPEIVRVAEEHAVDLVVVGTRGLSGFKHLALGSHAEYVVRSAACPVLTVHGGDSAFLADVRTIVVPTELEADLADVGAQVLDLVGPAARQARVLLVYSDYIPAALAPWVGEIGLDRLGLEQIRERLEQKLEPAIQRLEGMGFRVETVVSEGEPAGVITEVARAHEAELIAMATHGRSGMPRLVLGSTAERVVQLADCAVLTLRSRNDD